MVKTGELRKMIVSLDKDNCVDYQLSFYNSEKKENLPSISINQLLDTTITLEHTGNIYCKKCGSKTKKSYQQGFCYPCFKSAPEAAECIIHPERCKAHLGGGRDPEWEQKHHNVPQIVYLAANDSIKVGVTSVSQIPIRWIDQGAYKAITLAMTPNRYTAGVIEVALKQHFTDKTNWRTMLKNEIDESIDLEEVKWELEELLPEDITQYFTEDDEALELHYPVIEYPTKIKSIQLEKQLNYTGLLKGIKGQYFIFEDGRVINIRRHQGYEIKFSTNSFL